MTEKQKTLKDYQQPKAMSDALEKRYPRNLHKELWGRQDADAATSLYRWWWEFLRAARDFPKVAEPLMTDNEAAEKVAEVAADFGDLGDDFGDWWGRTGRNLFAEDGVPLIQVFKPEPDDLDYILRTGVVMVVPMTISRELILQQINVMLDIYHPGDDLRRHVHSTAKRKIFPKQRYRDVDYDLMIKIWRERKANPEYTEVSSTEGKLRTKTKNWTVPWWKIYANVRADDKLTKELEKSTLASAAERERYSKLAEKLYKQAEALMPNALIGDFPNDTAFQQKRQGKKKTGEPSS